MSVGLEQLSYVVQGRRVLDEVTATIPSAAHTCLLGANGAGKTTLFRILSGELRPTGGTFLIDEADASRLPQREISKHFATVPQGIGDPPHLSVRELVALGRFRPDRGLLGGLSSEDEEIVQHCIERCGVERFSDRPISQMSGGEKQRAWLAFCLAQEKEFLLLDEALDALDFLSRRTFFALLAEVAVEGHGVLLTTHDLGLAQEFASRIIVLNRGTVAYEGPPRSDLPRLLAPSRS